MQIEDSYLDNHQIASFTSTIQIVLANTVSSNLYYFILNVFVFKNEGK